MSQGARQQARWDPPRPLRRDALANQERLLAAAVSAILREGRQVPMATIAADAGLGVATLYRRFPNREALFDALTHRSFLLLLEAAEDTAALEGTPLEAVSCWLDRAISERDQLVVPLGGGPSVSSPATNAVQAELHRVLRAVLQRGQEEMSIRDDISVQDLIVFGAMLVRPLPGIKNWGRVARRHKAIYLDGLVPR